MSANPLTLHPAYGQLLIAYKRAREDWDAYPGVREAAESVGLNERAYCDSHIGGTQLAWASITTVEPLAQAHYDHAYALAGGQDAA